MVRKTKEEAQQTRCTLMATAMRLFCAKGLTNTSLSDVANAAGMTRGAIYWHFKNKAELFIAVWDELCHPLSAQLAASEDENEPDPLGKLYGFLTEVLHGVLHDELSRQLFSIVLDQERLGEELQCVQQHMDSESQRFSASLHKALQNAVAHGQLPASLDLARAVSFIRCTMDGYILYLLRFPDMLPEQQDPRWLLEFIFCSLKNMNKINKI